jgi:hypothetical protein
MPAVNGRDRLRELLDVIVALVLGVLESARVNDLGYGDPAGFVAEG